MERVLSVQIHFINQRIWQLSGALSLFSFYVEKKLFYNTQLHTKYHHTKLVIINDWNKECAHSLIGTLTSHDCDAEDEPTYSAPR